MEADPTIRVFTTPALCSGSWACVLSLAFVNLICQLSLAFVNLCSESCICQVGSVVVYWFGN